MFRVASNNIALSGVNGMGFVNSQSQASYMNPTQLQNNTSAKLKESETTMNKFTHIINSMNSSAKSSSNGNTFFQMEPTPKKTNNQHFGNLRAYSKLLPNLGPQ